jgi:chromosome segregation ATPase
MKKIAAILVTMHLISVTCAFAAEKSKLQTQLDASRAAVDTLAGKVGENREAAAALEKARTSLQKASDILGKGRQVLGISLGFGDVKPEAEEEVKTYLIIADNAVATATSRVESSRAAAELETIDKQLTAVKAKIKVFEERKAELEKLKADAAKCQALSKELESLKLEKSTLTMQVELLMAERNKAEKSKSDQADLLLKLDGLKAENSRLSNQNEKQLAEIKSLNASLEEVKKAAVQAPPSEKTIPAQAPEIPVSKEPTAVKETPAEK